MRTEFWVFDTNTLISALFNENSIPGIALKKARETGTLLISAEIASEYFTVFTRDKFEKYITLETRIAFVENIIANALIIEPVLKINVCRDSKDNKFLEVAFTAGATCIISGDQDLLILNPFNDIPIITPAVFLIRFN